MPATAGPSSRRSCAIWPSSKSSGLRPAEGTAMSTEVIGQHESTTRRPSSVVRRSRIEILISGFGGQGVIRLGQILGLTAIEQGLKVTMLKSHGTETRGGYVRAQ